MKKLLPLTILLPILISSCVSYPHSDFYTSEVDVEVYEIIEFYNNSKDYDYVEWDFGDGTYSTQSNPTHHYNSPGLYTVILTAVGYSGRTDVSSITVAVKIQTTLEITVLEYWDGYPVQNASVILYPSLYNWRKMSNPVLDNYGNILEGFTNYQGKVVFTGLSQVSYWLDVWHQHYNNYILGDEDEDFIRTLPLERNVINTFIAYVDYIESKSKKEGRETSQFKIVKIERVYKDKIESK